ncbi:hypothetical protein D4N07_12250 [Enterobacter hormaechei]|uniref:hypothetical protein n=1 Tax=Enterobacter hormaechei TaxID=158836 RepID=UPI0011DD0D62|nr:hypothetical protein [Enterobacter hormaechei]TXU04611.1 hypothetical protein D4N07_12250 [Enterobacter hormaechei]
MYTNIIIPVEIFSDSPAKRELSSAQYFSNINAGHVHLLAVIPNSVYLRAKKHFVDTKRLKKVLSTLAANRLAELTRRLVLPTGFVHRHIHFGDLNDAVRLLAIKKQADIVILDKGMDSRSSPQSEMDLSGFLQKNEIPVLLL